MPKKLRAHDALEVSDTNHAAHTMSSSDATDTVAASMPEQLPQIMRDIAHHVHEQAARWCDDTPAVSIGQARAMTALEETRIRYFETLGVLHPVKATAQTGSSRLYTLTDLRYLLALAILVKEHGYRPAEAAALVKRYRHLIESGPAHSFPDMLRQESNAVTDGFLLVRLLSQLMEAAQMELNDGGEMSAATSGSGMPTNVFNQGDARVRVVGLMLPLRSPFAHEQEATAEAVEQFGRTLQNDPRNTLIALDRSAVVEPLDTQIPPALRATGRNDSTVLFFSREAWELPGRDEWRYCVYMPAQDPHLLMVLILAAHETATLPHLLEPRVPARRVVFDRLLRLCAAIFQPFQQATLLKTYRYRSDGFQIEHTRETYRQMLATIRDIIFPGDPQSMAVLLIPNSLERPASLSILTSSGYDEDLALHAKLDLTSEEGQGLSGRAYKLREPFCSLDARSDPRVEYAMEENSQVALAVPLATGWGISPFGVLYLASQNPASTLPSDVAYTALILGNILSELLGRWWLTRLRRAQDSLLHQRAQDLVRWLDSLDPHGPDFQRALDRLQAIWRAIDPRDLSLGERYLTLVVFDIDQYRQQVQVKTNEPLPLHAQLHVRTAIRKILPDAEDYWFKNDHVLLVLEQCDGERAYNIAWRIAGQVRALPLDIYQAGEKTAINVSGTVKPMTYEELYDLDRQGTPRLRQQIQAIIDDLRMQTSRSSRYTIRLIAPKHRQTADRVRNGTSG